MRRCGQQDQTRFGNSLLPASWQGKTGWGKKAGANRPDLQPVCRQFAVSLMMGADNGTIHGAI